ncbi:MAG TPA: hypothetical protein PK778_02490, partial [Bacillota bacterium]|nr:hypothetical protein [Bacillota bacterium]
TWMVQTLSSDDYKAVKDELTLTFYNGYGYDKKNDDVFIKHDNSRLVIVVAYIVGDKIEYYEVATGIPAKGATLTINKTDDYYIEDGKGFLYIKTYFKSENDITASLLMLILAGLAGMSRRSTRPAL